MRILNPFTAEVAIMRLLGSAPMSHLCDQKRRSKVTGLSDLMTLFVDLGYLYCKQMQRAFNVFKNTLNWLKIDSVILSLLSEQCICKPKEQQKLWCATNAMQNYKNNWTDNFKNNHYIFHTQYTPASTQCKGAGFTSLSVSVSSFTSLFTVETPA
jgi:hypothetical protein